MTVSDTPTWDLETLFPGGPGGPAFARQRDELRARLSALDRHTAALDAASDPDTVVFALLDLDRLADAMSELSSFAACAGATDSRSQAARSAEADSDELDRHRDLIRARVAAALDALDDASFEALLARQDLAILAPQLRHSRAARELRLPPALQALKIAMDREALTAWGRLYDQVSGGLTAEVEIEGEVRRLGIAEVAAMRAEPEPAVRRAAFDASARAWTSVRDICAHALTQIVGNRLQHNDRLGVGPLADTLHDNRIDAAVLDAMWAASDAARPALVRYLRHKAALLGKDALDWWDVDAPVGGEAAGAWSWEHATQQIFAAFGGFHPELAGFAREAVAGRWIDALPREGRRPGGFCTPFPRSNQSRIFMTFTGSLDNATTLAHELGHAFHNRVLEGRSASRRALTSALAETASTFAEAVFRDRILASATDRDFRAFMLDQQLQAAAVFLMDIPHRFTFERRLYELRREGVFDADTLSSEIVTIQQQCYGGALGSWDPMFWCSKLHFYIPEFGFYNWPYAFGYLFSSAVHAEARRVGPDFLGTLRDLLERTGWQDTSALAAEVLGVDLRSPDFWRTAVASIPGWVDAFVESTTD